MNGDKKQNVMGKSRNNYILSVVMMAGCGKTLSK
jgi:hypothetical protein